MRISDWSSDVCSSDLQRVAVSAVNALRLHVFNGLNAQPWCRPTYLALGRPVIDAVVGNELAMQNKVNLSIQMPRDETSTLAMHADVWSAETPYEVVQWTPLVDVHNPKADRQSNSLNSSH